jgi:hypothetical protein
MGGGWTSEGIGCFREHRRAKARERGISVDRARAGYQGGAAGGPIRKNRVFLFADLERMNQRQAQVFKDTLPTAAMRSGDFTEQKALTDPLSGKPFPGNIIPQDRISQQARYFLKYMPSVEQGSFNAPQSLDVNKGDIKTDARLTQRHNLMLRYSIRDNLERDPNQFETGRSCLIPCGSLRRGTSVRHRE